MQHNKGSRFWDYCKFWFGFTAPADKSDETPEALLERAQTQMREVQARNRMRAVEAVTAKNNLQQQVKDTQKRVANLTEKADNAEKRGDLEIAQSLRRECARWQKALSEMEKNAAKVASLTEEIKGNIHREEERIRQKTAEALALKSEWESNKIYKGFIDDWAREYPPRRNGHDQWFRWLVATYFFIVVVLLLVLLIIKAGRW